MIRYSISNCTDVIVHILLQLIPGVLIYLNHLHGEIAGLNDQIEKTSKKYTTLKNDCTSLENNHKKLNKAFDIIMIQMKQIQHIREEKDVIKQKIEKMDQYYKLLKKNSTDPKSLSQDEIIEMYELGKHFEEKLPKAHTAIARTNDATNELLTQFESLEKKYQEMLIRGDIEEMQAQQAETENNIREIFAEGRALIKQAERENDTVSVSAETIFDVLFQVARKFVN